MAKLSPIRRFLKIFHPEGIPGVGTVFYNIIASADVFQRHYELVARDILSHNLEGNVLDIGTGPGWLLVKLYHQSPRLRITGLDISPSMIAKARKNIVEARLAEAIEVREGSASQLPFADNSYDTIVSTGSLHHWKDPIGGLNEIYRVLKSGGYALLYDIVSDTPAAVLEDMASEYGRLRMVLLWLHTFEEPFYSRKAFEELAQPSSFRRGQTRFVGVLCCLTLKKENGAQGAGRPNRESQ